MSSSNTSSNDSGDGGSASQPPSNDGSTNLSKIPLPASNVYAVWSPEEQQKYANEQSAMKEELVVKLNLPAKLERCDNRGVSKKEVLKKIDNYVKGIWTSKFKHLVELEDDLVELEDELTYVNADVKKVLAEPDDILVLNNIYAKYSTPLTDNPFE